LHYGLKKDAINEFGIKYWTSNPVWVIFQEHGSSFYVNIEEKVWLLAQIFPHFALKSREREVKSPCFYYVCRAPTTLKSEGEMTSLSGADKREVRDNRVLFIYYLLDNSWLSYMCLYHLCKTKQRIWKGFT
jgi:hypothetical protein